MLRVLFAIVMILASGYSHALQPVEVLSITLSNDEEFRLGHVILEECSELTGASQNSLSLTVKVDPEGRYFTEQTSRDQAVLESSMYIDLNAWRRTHPDVFEPGPLNGLFGALGLADARSITTSIDAERDDRSLVIEWDRRKDDGVTQRVEFAKLSESSADSIEWWDVHGVGLEWCIRAVARIGFEISEPDPAASKYQRFDRYTRARSTLIRSLARAEQGMSLCITEEHELAVVVEFESVIKTGSIQKALDRLLVDDAKWLLDGEWSVRQVPALVVGAAEFAPELVVGQVGSTPVLIASLRQGQAQAVAGAMQSK